MAASPAFKVRASAIDARPGQDGKPLGQVGQHVAQIGAGCRCGGDAGPDAGNAEQFDGNIHDAVSLLALKFSAKWSEIFRYSRFSLFGSGSAG